MNLDVAIAFIHGWAVLLVSFSLAIAYSMFKGRQALINLICGAYLALLLYQLFPAKAKVAEMTGSDKSEAVTLLLLFVAFTTFGAWLFSRLMPSEFLEGAFETMGKKILLALAAMILILTLSTHYLPIGEVIPMGTPLPEMLLTEKLAYVWLLVPLAVLFVI